MTFARRIALAATVGFPLLLTSCGGTPEQSAIDPREKIETRRPDGLELVRTIHGDETIWCCAISPDGEFIVTGTDSGQVRLHRIDEVEGTKPRVLVGHQGRITRLVFSPDGSRIASASNDGFAIVWDIEHETEVRRLPHPGEVHGLAFSPDGRELATGIYGPKRWHGRKSIVVWDLAQGIPARDLMPTAGVAEIAYSPDGQELAAGLILNEPNCVVDTKTWRDVRAFGGVGKWTTSLAFRPNSPILAIASVESPSDIETAGQITFFDLEAQESAGAIYPQPGPSSIAFDPSGTHLMGAFEEAPGVRIWNMETRTIDWAWGAGDATQLEVSADGRYLAVCRPLPATVELWLLPASIR